MMLFRQAFSRSRVDLSIVKIGYSERADRKKEIIVLQKGRGRRKEGGIKKIYIQSKRKQTSLKKRGQRYGWGKHKKKLNHPKTAVFPQGSSHGGLVNMNGALTL